MILCAGWILQVPGNTMPSEIKARLVILASGGGSNADQICSFFDGHDLISVEAVFTNHSNAGVVQVAESHHLPCYTFLKPMWADKSILAPVLEFHQITHIVLAGFLLLIPRWLIEAYPDHIINIHPALLPKYGGKGMYGHHVHEAVKQSGDRYSGITIHTIDEHYDRGTILFQHEVGLEPGDNADQIAAKVLIAEHTYYPRVIEQWVLGQPIH